MLLLFIYIYPYFYNCRQFNPRQEWQTKVSSVSDHYRTEECGRIVTSLQNLQKKVDQELADSQSKARGRRELTVGDIWAEQGNYM